uniref:Uncharacterized protein n=1 Tax=Trypanosoma vivax (strain Y486) TaxID=1055687 RepID=G0U1R2_TRYVY|nr:hypothetical protein, unlikely [Trypanosoma vivax Y486]
MASYILLDNLSYFRKFLCISVYRCTPVRTRNGRENQGCPEVKNSLGLLAIGRPSSSSLLCLLFCAFALFLHLTSHTPHNQRRITFHLSKHVIYHPITTAPSPTTYCLCFPIFLVHENAALLTQSTTMNIFYYYYFLKTTITTTFRHQFIQVTYTNSTGARNKRTYPLERSTNQVKKEKKIIIA